MCKRKSEKQNHSSLKQTHVSSQNIQKANDKISAQNKLKALGLTDAEIEAL